MGNCMETDGTGVVPLNNTTFDPKMINHTIDIYFFPGSPPARAALMLIKALGMKHNVKTLNLVAGEHMNPDFLKINPMHTVPTIDDKGFILWDSHVIMKYLVDQYAKDDSLFPKDPKKGALVNKILFFNATFLHPRLSDYLFPVLYNGEQPDPNKAEKFEEGLNLLDGFLKNQPWIAGQFLTIADFSIIAVIATAEAINFEISNYLYLSEWYQRAKNVMSGFGYEDINQAGANAVGALFRSKLNT